MNKKIIYILGLIWTLAACESINLEPTDFIDKDKALQTYADYEQAVLGVYSSAFSANYWGQNGSCRRYYG
jgi:hypothetical protein